MKFLILISLFVTLLNTYNLSQTYQNVFIMVDKSGTMIPDISFQMKNVLKEVLVGKSISNSNFSIETGNALNINNNALIQAGANLFLLSFGNRVNKITIPTISISNLDSDVNNFIENNYPIRFNDQNTYLNLTQAQIAEFAKNNNIINYLLIVVSDFRKDQGPNISNEELKLMDSIEKRDSGAIKSLVAAITYNPNRVFGIRFYEWNLSKWRKYGSSGSIIPSTSNNCEIRFLTISGGTINKPVEIDKNDFTINWSINCQASSSFIITITGMEGNDHRDRKNVAGLFYTTKLENGKYRVTVTANVGAGKTPSIKPATTIINVSAGNSFFILFLLLMAIGGTIGYYIWKNKLLNKNKNKETFSKTTEW